VNCFSDEPACRGGKTGVKEYNGDLITGYTAGVLQRARTIFRLIYGTREPAYL